MSIFTITAAYTLAYKKIPIPEGGSVVRLCTGDAKNQCGPFRARELFEMRDELSSLSEIAVTTAAGAYLETESFGMSVFASQAESTLFPLSRTVALIGRTLQEYDQDASAEPVVVLSFETWSAVFNQDAAVINTKVKVDGIQRTIVGVMPEGFRFPANSQIWLPIEQSLLRPLQNDSLYVTAYARLLPGHSRNAASAQIGNVMKIFRTRNPLSVDEYGAQTFDQINGANVASLPMALVGGRTGILALAVINILAILIFLLVCINVGTLLLARVNERIRDVSIRVALGAPLHRLLAQTMSENVFISIIGGIMALFLAGFFLEILNWFLISTVKEEAPFWFEFSIDKSTILGVVIFILLTIVLTCTVPSLKIINGDFNSVMRDGTRGAVGIRVGKSSRNIVVAAIALISLLLYVGALAGSSALLYKGVFADRDTSNLIGANLPMPEDRYTINQRQQVFSSLYQQLSQSSVVERALIFGDAGRMDVDSNGATSETSVYNALVQGVSGDLQAVSATLFEGRYLNDRDSPESPQVAVLSRSLADKLWPQGTAIDRQVWLSGESFEGIPRRVVGVVGDTLISGQSLITPQTDAIYIPLGQSPWLPVRAYIRYVGDASQASSLLRTAILSNGLEPPIQVVNFADDQAAAVKAMNSGLTLVISCGIFAFLVALTGIYGLTSNAVVLRTQEIGTRRALGATDSRISKMFVLNGLTRVLSGIAIAAVISLPISYLVFSTASAEFMAIAMPLLGALIAALIVSLLIAVYLPIKKILRMEPMEALRCQ